MSTGYNSGKDGTIICNGVKIEGTYHKYSRNIFTSTDGTLYVHQGKEYGGHNLRWKKDDNNRR